MNDIVQGADVRAGAARLLWQVIDGGKALSPELTYAQSRLRDGRDRALLQQLCFGVLRDLPRFDHLSRQLLEKPLARDARPIHFLLLVGLWQLRDSRIPAHAAVAATVAAAALLRAPGLKGLVNAVLRRYQREQSELEQQPVSEVVATAHPSWLLKRLQRAYPEHWPQIVAANNRQPPIWLRPNQRQLSPAAYSEQLERAEIGHQPPTDFGAIALDSGMAVEQLPGFSDGAVFIQDGAAQLAAIYLGPQPGERILDACAAPGGKTSHLLELQPALAEVVALDCDEGRLDRVEDNLQRLRLQATIRCGDGRYPERWWDGRPFDRILVDAPCSATGVIRRHPEIKWLRRDSDVAPLVETQRQLLDALWPLLKAGGTLLYATCSLLPDENGDQVAAFLERHVDARLLQLPGQQNAAWHQRLPGEDDMDGFFYGLLGKAL
ncbi:MAG: 16S rRNA (cytosine(967)-C(5))-methyltransferase RsmB [Gammaproteobacteria bacterium]|nr:16S rRNA (cytosine(967)-C(5))-methyltransferase RsmB [Gammaproteobacteria bacterium]